MDTDMDTWEYGMADLDPQSDHILSTHGPVPQATGAEMENDLLNYLLRVGSVGWELLAVVPFGDRARLFFKKHGTDEG